MQSKNTQEMKERTKAEFREMWDAGKFSKNYVECNFKGKEGVSILRLFDTVIDTLIDKVAEKERERIVDILQEAKITRKITHGNCCTCQTCGLLHDDCQCEHNRLIDNVINIIKHTNE